MAGWNDKQFSQITSDEFKRMKQDEQEVYGKAVINAYDPTKQNQIEAESAGAKALADYRIQQASMTQQPAASSMPKMENPNTIRWDLIRMLQGKPQYKPNEVTPEQQSWAKDYSNYKLPTEVVNRLNAAGQNVTEQMSPEEFGKYLGSHHPEMKDIYMQTFQEELANNGYYRDEALAATQQKLQPLINANKKEGWNANINEQAAKYIMQADPSGGLLQTYDQLSDDKKQAVLDTFDETGKITFGGYEPDYAHVLKDAIEKQANAGKPFNFGQVQPEANKKPTARQTHEAKLTDINDQITALEDERSSIVAENAQIDLGMTGMSEEEAQKKRSDNLLRKQEIENELDELNQKKREEDTAFAAEAESGKWYSELKDQIDVLTNELAELYAQKQAGFYDVQPQIDEKMAQLADLAVQMQKGAEERGNANVLAGIDALKNAAGLGGIGGAKGHNLATDKLLGTLQYTWDKTRGVRDAYLNFAYNLMPEFARPNMSVEEYNKTVSNSLQSMRDKLSKDYEDLNAKASNRKQAIVDDVINISKQFWTEEGWEQFGEDPAKIEQYVRFVLDNFVEATGEQIGQQWPMILTSVLTGGAGEGLKGIAKLKDIISSPAYWQTFMGDFCANLTERYDESKQKDGRPLTDLDVLFLAGGSLVNAYVEHGMGGDEAYRAGLTSVLGSVFGEIKEEVVQDKVEILRDMLADLAQHRDSNTYLYSNDKDTRALINPGADFETAWKTALTTLGMDALHASTFGAIQKLANHQEISAQEKQDLLEVTDKMLGQDPGDKFSDAANGAETETANDKPAPEKTEETVQPDQLEEPAQEPAPEEQPAVQEEPAVQEQTNNEDETNLFSGMSEEQLRNIMRIYPKGVYSHDLAERTLNRMQGKEVQAEPASTVKAPAGLDDQQAEAFKEKFGNSQAVDDTGAPIDFYHGTDADFDKFDASKAGTRSAGDKGFYGKGTYFGLKEETARLYGKNIKKAWLKMENPFRLEKELGTINGEEAPDGYQSQALALNVEEKLPELDNAEMAKAITKDGQEVKLTIKEYAEMFRQALAENNNDVKKAAKAVRNQFDKLNVYGMETIIQGMDDFTGALARRKYDSTWKEKGFKEYIVFSPDQIIQESDLKQTEPATDGTTEQVKAEQGSSQDEDLEDVSLDEVNNAIAAKYQGHPENITDPNLRNMDSDKLQAIAKRKREKLRAEMQPEEVTARTPEETRKLSEKLTEDEKIKEVGDEKQETTGEVVEPNIPNPTPPKAKEGKEPEAIKEEKPHAEVAEKPEAQTPEREQGKETEISEEERQGDIVETQKKESHSEEPKTTPEVIQRKVTPGDEAGEEEAGKKNNKKENPTGDIEEKAKEEPALYESQSKDQGEPQVGEESGTENIKKPAYQHNGKDQGQPQVGEDTTGRRQPVLYENQNKNQGEPQVGEDTSGTHKKPVPEYQHEGKNQGEPETGIEETGKREPVLYDGKTKNQAEPVPGTEQTPPVRPEPPVEKVYDADGKIINENNEEPTAETPTEPTTEPTTEPVVDNGEPDEEDTEPKPDEETEPVTEQKTETEEQNNEDTDTDTEQKQKKIDEETKAVAEQNHFKFGKTQGDGSQDTGVHLVGTGNNISKARMFELQVIDRFAKHFGFSVEVSNMGDDTNGHYNKGGRTVYINQNSENPFQTVMAHEAYHMVQSISEKSAKQIADLFDKYAAEAGIHVDHEIDSIIAQYERAGKLSSLGEDVRAGAKEELIANSMYKLLSDEQTIRRIYNTDRGMFQKIMDFVSRVQQSIQQMLKQYEANTPEARMLARQQGALENMHRQMLDALEDMKKLDDAKRKATERKRGDTTIRPRFEMTQKFEQKVSQAENRAEITDAVRDLARDVLKATGNEVNDENIRKVIGAAQNLMEGTTPYKEMMTSGLKYEKNDPGVNEALELIRNYEENAAREAAQDSTAWNQLMYGRQQGNKAKYSMPRDKISYHKSFLYDNAVRFYKGAAWAEIDANTLEVLRQNQKDKLIPELTESDIEQAKKTIKENYKPEPFDGEVYIRFGNIPKTANSKNYANGKTESGVSCYKANWDVMNGTYDITGSGLVGAELNYLIKNAPIYLIKGERSGIGSDGEPTVKNVKALSRLYYDKNKGAYILQGELAERDGKKRHKAEDVSYEALTKKPDIDVVKVNKIDKSEISKIQQSRKNYTESIANKMEGNIYVKDIGRDVTVTKRSIDHSGRRELTDNYIYICNNLDKILANSVAVNELKPRDIVSNYSNILIGVAETDDKYIFARFNVENRSWQNKTDSELVNYDFLYSITKAGIKKDEVARVKRAAVAGNPDTPLASSKMSIAQMLNIVKNSPEFAGAVSKDVADHLGYTRPKIDISDDLVFSLPSSERAKYDAAKAEQYFGTTTNFNKSGYLTTNGKLLDMSGKHEGYDSGHRAVDHRYIQRAYESEMEDVQGTEAMIEFMRDGNIRLSPESDGIDLMAMPNEKQIPMLKQYIRKAGGEVTVDISDQRGNVVESFEYDSGTSAQKVIDDLRGYFEYGIVPEEYQYSVAGPREVNEQAGREATERQFEFTGGQTEALQRLTGDLWRAIAERKANQKAENYGLWKQHVAEMARELKAATNSAVFTDKQLEDRLTQILEEHEQKKTGSKEAAEHAVNDTLNELQGLIQEALSDQLMDEHAREVFGAIKKGIYFNPDMVKEIGGQSELREWRNAFKGICRIYTSEKAANDAGAMHLDGHGWDELQSIDPDLFNPETHWLERAQALREFVDLYSDSTMRVDPVTRDFIQTQALETLAEYYSGSNDSDATKRTREALKKANSKIDSLTREQQAALKKQSELTEQIRNLKQQAREADSQAWKDRSAVQAERDKLQQELKASREEALELGRQLNEAGKEAERLTNELNAKDSRVEYLKSTLDLVKKQNAENQREAIKRNRENAKQRAQDVKNRHKIKDVGYQLRKMLENPTDTSHVPAQYVREMLEMVQAVQSADVSKRARGTARWNRAVQQMTEDTTNYTTATAFDDDTKKVMQEAMDLLNEKKINDLNSDELQFVANVLTQAVHQMKQAGKMINRKQNTDALLEAKSAVDTINAQKPTATGGIKKMAQDAVTEHLRPESEFNKLAGYQTDNAIHRSYEELNKGANEAKTAKMTMESYFTGLMEGENAKNYKKWTGPKSEIIDTGIKGSKYGTFKLNHDFLTRLYMDSLSQENMAGMKNGLTMPDYKLWMQGKYQEAWARSERMHLTEADWKNLMSQLTEYDKAWAKGWQEMLKYSTPKLNNVSMAMHGWRKFNVENYFPIRRDKNYLATDFEALTMDVRLANAGWTKARKNATSPMMLVPMSEVVRQYINGASQYIGLAAPLQNFSKMFNTTMPGYEDSMKSALKRVFGTKDYEYIERLITDLNTGGQKSDASALDKLRNQAAGSALGANATVIMKQPVSFIAAAAELGYGPLIKAMTSTRKFDAELVKKYTPAYWERTAENIQAMNANANAGTLNKTSSFLSKAIAASDNMTVRRLWIASEYAVEEEQPNLKRGSEEYNKAVADKFNKVVERTQPEYGTMQRTHISRSNNQLVKGLTMYKTQAMQNYNIVYDSVADYAAQAKRYKADPSAENKEEMDRAKTKMARALSSQIISAAALAVMTALGKALLHKPEPYQDDKGEITAESLTYQLSKDALSSMAGMMVGGSELFDLITGIAEGKQPYDIEASQVSMVNDLYQAVYKLGSAATSIGNSNMTKEQKLEKAGKAVDTFAQSVGAIFGLPVKNIENIYNSAKKYVDDITSGRGLEGLTTGDVSTTKAAKYMGEALQKGDTETYTRLYNRLLKQGKTQKEITSALKTWMKKGDARIQQAADAIDSGDLDTYNRLINDMVKDGYGMAAVVTTIESVRKADNKSEEEPAATEYAPMTYDQIMAAQEKENASEYTYAQLNQLLENGNLTAARKVQSVLFKAKKNGTTAVKSALTSYWKPKYREAYQSRNRAELNRITKLMKAMGYSDASLKKWKEADTTTTTSSKKTGWGSSSFGSSSKKKSKSSGWGSSTFGKGWGS